MKTKDELVEETLEITGQIADLLRELVGGRNLNGDNIVAASVEYAGKIVPELRKLLDRYDTNMLNRLSANDTVLPVLKIESNEE